MPAFAAVDPPKILVETGTGKEKPWKTPAGWPNNIPNHQIVLQGFQHTGHQAGHGHVRLLEAAGQVGHGGAVGEDQAAAAGPGDVLMEILGQHWFEGSLMFT